VCAAPPGGAGNRSQKAVVEPPPPFSHSAVHGQSFAKWILEANTCSGTVENSGRLKEKAAGKPAAFSVVALLEKIWLDFLVFNA